jgi:hypothetical protein
LISKPRSYSATAASSCRYVRRVRANYRFRKLCASAKASGVWSYSRRFALHTSSLLEIVWPRSRARVFLRRFNRIAGAPRQIRAFVAGTPAASATEVVGQVVVGRATTTGLSPASAQDRRIYSCLPKRCACLGRSTCICSAMRGRTVMFTAFAIGGPTCMPQSDTAPLSCCR